jgi:uncharacterized protein YecT (DUF1311 family)
MTRSFLAALFLLLLATVSFAQDESKHPIDKAYDACADKDPSTAGLVRCTDIAYLAWDKELNKNYLALMSKLKPAQKDVLKAAQLEWIKLRDADFKLIDSLYDTLQGTMYIPMRLDSRLELVKRRALQLKDYLGLIEEGAD